MRAIPFSRVLLYLALALASPCLYHVGNNGEPFPLALAYGTASTGLSPSLSALIFLLPYIFNATLPVAFTATAQGFLLWFGFFLERKIGKRDKRTGACTVTALVAALALFLGFAPFSPYPLPQTGTFALSTQLQKLLFAALTFLLAAVFSVALNALFKKSLRCRLRGDELLFCALFFLLVGVGFCRFAGFNAYLSVAFFLILVCSVLTKDAYALLLAFLLALPPLLVGGNVTTRLFFLAAACVLAAPSGRLTAACAFLSVFFLCGYFDGMFAYPTPQLLSALFSALLPTLLFLLLPSALLRTMEKQLVFYRDRRLTRVVINRNRAAVGEKLFDLSAVFREIETSFSALGDTEAEDAARARMRTQIVNELCAQCPRYPICKKARVEAELARLLEVGCLKGKTSLLDLPRALADTCNRQSDLLYAANRQIADYRKYLLETENAACGRALLAKQARGVSEILKNLALEQSAPLTLYTDRERTFSAALLRAGIVCSEVLVYGDEDDFTLSLVTFGKADVKKIAAVASHVFARPIVLSERISLDGDKFCCILRKRPRFDAAFGVSSVTKTGSSACGDRHSVLKIDERRFLVLLSDGMGSGEYAKKVSESAVSLLESFYRAKMPPDLVLNTVNKLLAFDREERFACVDIAVVDLDDGRADVVKIGSPLGFILSGNTVKVLEGNGLPLGILDALRPDAASYTLLENDVLLFLSDGVVDAFGSATDLYDALRSLPLGNPQAFTDALLEAALRVTAGSARDDMTAVAVRLFENPAV